MHLPKGYEPSHVCLRFFPEVNDQVPFDNRSTRKFHERNFPPAYLLGIYVLPVFFQKKQFLFDFLNIIKHENYNLALQKIKSDNNLSEIDLSSLNKSVKLSLKESCDFDVELNN